MGSSTQNNFLFYLNFVLYQLFRVRTLYYNLPKLSDDIKLTMVGFVYKARAPECALLNTMLVMDSTRNLALFYHCLDGDSGIETIGVRIGRARK